MEHEDGFEADSQLLESLKGTTVLIKYGGNAMIEASAKENVLDQIATLGKLDIHPVIVHGGGPVIKKLLENVGIDSVFVGGHRKTDERSMQYVEMALNGQVNGEIVKGISLRGLKAVGLSGKDALMVRAERRLHDVEIDGKREQVDLGYVGNVLSIDTKLVKILLEHDYIPVLAPIGVGSDGMDYNINADMFAGHLAGALNVSALLAMTDVDGLLDDPGNPSTRIVSISADEVKARMGKSIRGGMVPKLEACLVALAQGVEKAHIINGMKPDTLLTELLTNNKSGTTITRNQSDLG